jgi:hypothetical protein
MAVWAITPDPNRCSRRRRGTLPFRKPGRSTCLASSRAARSKACLTRLGSTSTVSLTWTGSIVSVDVFTMGGSSSGKGSVAARARGEVGSCSGTGGWDPPTVHGVLRLPGGTTGCGSLAGAGTIGRGRWTPGRPGARMVPPVGAVSIQPPRTVGGERSTVTTIAVQPRLQAGGEDRDRRYAAAAHGVWRSLVSAPALGAGGRRFESGHPDQHRRSGHPASASPAAFGLPAGDPAVDLAPHVVAHLDDRLLEVGQGRGPDDLRHPAIQHSRTVRWEFVSRSLTDSSNSTCSGSQRFRRRPRLPNTRSR